MPTDRYATRTSARPDAHAGPARGTVNAVLRAEAVRQLRGQQRDWARILATNEPDLIAGAAPAGFTDGLDLLREAGKHVPPWLYRRGSPVVTSGTTGTARLTHLLADLRQTLAWVDPEPSARDQAVSAERPPPSADGDRGPRVGGSSAANPDRTVPSVQTRPRAEAAARATGERRSRPVRQGGGGVTCTLRDESHEAAAGEWAVGDQVTARANTINVQVGRRGTVVAFSSVGGHPLVDFAGSGLALIRAEHLDRDGDAPPEAGTPGRPQSPRTTRLSATPQARAVAATPPPPVPDWCDRPIATTAT